MTIAQPPDSALNTWPRAETKAGGEGTARVAGASISQNALKLGARLGLPVAGEVRARLRKHLLGAPIDTITRLCAVAVSTSPGSCARASQGKADGEKKRPAAAVAPAVVDPEFEAKKKARAERFAAANAATA